MATRERLSTVIMISFINRRLHRALEMVLCIAAGALGQNKKYLPRTHHAIPNICLVEKLFYARLAKRKQCLRCIFETIAFVEVFFYIHLAVQATHTRN